MGSSAAESSSTGQPSSLRLVSSRYFSSACLRTRSISICERFSCVSCTAARSAFELFFVGAQGFAHGGVLRGHLVDLGFERGDLLGQLRAPSDRARYCRPAGARAVRRGARSPARWRCGGWWFRGTAAPGGPWRSARRDSALPGRPVRRESPRALRRWWPPGLPASRVRARCVSSACSLSARRRSFSATAVRLRSRWSADFSASRRRRSSSRRATLTRELVRARSSPSLRIS